MYFHWLSKPSQVSAFHEPATRSKMGTSPYKYFISSLLSLAKNFDLLIHELEEHLPVEFYIGGHCSSVKGLHGGIASGS